jgi:hypothetical protein
VAPDGTLPAVLSIARQEAGSTKCSQCAPRSAWRSTSGRRRSRASAPIEPDLRKINCPTIVVCGRDDAAQPLLMSEEITATIQGSELITIEPCGHLITMEKPGETNAILRKCLLESERAKDLVPIAGGTILTTQRVSPGLFDTDPAISPRVIGLARSAFSRHGDVSGHWIQLVVALDIVL